MQQQGSTGDVRWSRGRAITLMLLGGWALLTVGAVLLATWLRDEQGVVAAFEIIGAILLPFAFLGLVLLHARLMDGLAKQGAED